MGDVNAKMRTKPLTEVVDVGLHRPTYRLSKNSAERLRSYRNVVCLNCQPPFGNGSQWEVSLTDNGQWTLECTGCRETAIMLTDLFQAVAEYEKESK